MKIWTLSMTFNNTNNNMISPRTPRKYSEDEEHQRILKNQVEDVVTLLAYARDIMTMEHYKDMINTLLAHKNRQLNSEECIEAVNHLLIHEGYGSVLWHFRRLVG